jgi:hypothetical protein
MQNYFMQVDAGRNGVGRASSHNVGALDAPEGVMFEDSDPMIDLDGLARGLGDPVANLATSSAAT